MSNNKEKSISDCFEIVLSRLQQQKNDPIRELKDTEEEEAFETIMNHNLTKEQILKILPSIGTYCSILYDFPYGYPEYDKIQQMELFNSVIKKYDSRINRLEKYMAKLNEN